jgi:hypothetical protein
MIYLGEEFADDGAGGLKLFITSETLDSYNVDRKIRVRHEFLVPRASYTRDVWAAWLFDRYCDVESHEAGEFLKINGVREFGPHHGNGEDPYRIWHVGDYADTRVKAGNPKSTISDAELIAALKEYGKTPEGQAWLKSLDLPPRLPELYGNMHYSGTVPGEEELPDNWERCDMFGMHPIGAHEEYVQDNA